LQRNLQFFWHIQGIPYVIAVIPMIIEVVSAVIAIVVEPVSRIVWLITNPSIMAVRPTSRDPTFFIDFVCIVITC